TSASHRRRKGATRSVPSIAAGRRRTAPAPSIDRHRTGLVTEATRAVTHRGDRGTGGHRRAGDRHPGWCGRASARRRQTSHVRVTSSGEVLPVRPSEVFVVERPGAEAAVEDSDEPVADHTERAGVCVTGGSSLVVEGSGAG